MNTKRYLTVAFLFALFVFGASACVRSKATEEGSPVISAPGGGDQPTIDVMEQLQLFVTQTAMAIQAQGGQVPVQQVTLAPPAATDTTAPIVQPTAAPIIQPTAVPPVVVAPTAVIVPSATPGLPSSYTLRTGEFPYCIARRFNVNPSELLSINGLSTQSYYYAGMTLKIPQTGNGFPSDRTLRSHPTSYTVSGDESIFAIACKFGDVDPSSIVIANGLAEPYNLQSGQTIQIP